MEAVMDRSQIITQALHEWRRVGGTSDTFVAERIIEAIDRAALPGQALSEGERWHERWIRDGEAELVLREAVQALLDWYDGPPFVYEESDMETRLNALRDALRTQP